MHLSMLASFFLVGWWLRPRYPEWVPELPYYGGFLLSIPAALAILSWAALGMPGCGAALRDGRRWWLLALALLALWMLLSPNWARYPEQATTFSQQFAFVALFALAAVCAGPPPRGVALALALGLVWQAVIVVMQFGMQRDLGLQVFGEFRLGPFRADLSVIASGPDRLMRPYGLTVHPNIIGGYLTVALLALTGWLVTDRDLALWRRAVRLAVMVLGLWALCLTFSRGAWGALVGGLALTGLAWRRRCAARPAWRRLALVGIVAALTIGAFGLSYPNYLRARTGVDQDVTELRSIVDRRIFMEFAVQIFQENWLIGTGMGTFPWEARDKLLQSPYRYSLRAENVHNMPLLALSELGLIGFGLWVAAWATGLLLAWRRACDPCAAGLAAGSAALLAIGLLDHYPWTILHFSLLLWASLAVAIRTPGRANAAGAGLARWLSSGSERHERGQG